MKLSNHMSVVLLLAATLACGIPFNVFCQTSEEPEKLIESIAARQQMGDLSPDNLRDGNAGTKYHTWDETDTRFSGEQYLEVTLTNPLDLASDEDIVVYLQRCDDCDNRQPTVFKVVGSTLDNPTDDSWEDFCRVYFLYRGKSTREYSARIHTERKFKKLRFYVIANNTRSYDSEGHHSMGLSEFEIYKVKRDGYYPYPMADQFHLRDDYKRDYEDYTFVKTMGWLDPRNRSVANTTDNCPAYEDGSVNNEAVAKGDLDIQKSNIEKLSKWAEWDKDWSADGTWNLDEEKLLELGVQMPSLAPIKDDPDFDPKANMQCQPTHVTEHILYALPGDPIILTPYGNFAEAKHFEKYEVNFAHWYDYRTGDKIVYDDKKGNVTNLLDFLADPWAVCTSKENGYFGAYLLTEKNGVIPRLQAQNYGMSATFFCPRDPYIEDGEAHSLPFRPIDKALSNNINEEDEFVIAADFSQSFNKGRNLNTTNKEIIEPNIAFRHIFRIRDGKALADSLSSTVAKNKAYVKRNRRDITARANKPFQIGLDVSIPEPTEVDGRWRSIPSEYYYKVSNSDYRRINAMRLRVTHDGVEENLSNGESRDAGSTFYFGEGFAGLGSRVIDNVRYRICLANDKDNNDFGKYLRMLKSDKSLSGKYKVEIIGQEIIGEAAPTDIKIIGTSEPLVVMEFDIDFVDNEDSGAPQAILVSSERLHTDSRFKSFREDEMVKKYGQAKDRIDFDYYRGLETLPSWKQYLDARIDGSKHYQFRWPAAWSKSQYANGYSNDHNYNMYVVANHTSRTPYHNFWHHNENHKDEESFGLYDRLNDKTTRLNKTDASVAVENGYFLYVNAASDPGVMVTLNVDNLCTGSTVHVSAWVAELSKEEEMANIVFNFVAVLANGDRVNLHSFVSGYVSRNIGDYHNPSVNTYDGGPGQWMNISYSFNPDVTRFNAGMIDHYELELENNCKSSSGADYAIDDINVYIVSPVVAAEQESPLCTDVADGEENLVRIELPFTETLQSIDVAEAKTVDKDEVIKLQYVILDREKFDAAYDAAERDASENPGLTAYEAGDVVIGSGTVEFHSYADSNTAYSAIDGQNAAGLLTNERDVRMIAFQTNFDDTQFKVGKEYYISLYVAKKDDQIEPNWTQFDITDPCAKYCIFQVKSKNNIRIDGEVRGQDGEISVCEGESPTISIDIATKEGSLNYESAFCDWFMGSREEYDAIEEGAMSLYKAMNYFREAYPAAASPENVLPKGDFTEEMRQYILAHKDMLLFYKNSYKFPALMIPEGEKKAEDAVLVLPIPQPEDNMTVCTAPMEIRICADLHSPKLLHGLVDGIIYPENMENVPLRIGLDQLSKVSVDEGSETSADTPLLVIPIRKVATSGVVSNVKAMSKKSDVIMLESTTDPNYDLSAKQVTSESGEIYNVLPEYEAGKICSFKAQVDGIENSLGAVFYKDFIFREGYEYTFSYVFKETVAADSDVKLCDGRTRFTIKVVPEYLVWTPANDSRNWNNDGNWQRVSSESLMADLKNEEVNSRLDRKVKDGSNGKVGAYMPMDFTKVILPNATETQLPPFMYDWNVNDNAIAGEATDLIEYDMVAKETSSNVKCDIWVPNICKEIHFKPNATIMNQQHLKYENAWIDLELSPSRWYTLSMPLKKVFAGEFYLPSDNACQQTELFQEIRYNPDINDRFNPAVFQRGWDKGAAAIYHPDKDATSAVVKANWSHVYNDVEESYGSGVGFSIKADVSGVENASDKVLFRLPKADAFYAYYDNEGKELNTANRKDIDHEGVHYKLNDENGTISVTTAETSTVAKKYFLVGNPFMTHLDMAKFLYANRDKVAQKYWMITAGSQKMGVFDEESDGFVGDATGYVAPMQGFFVEATGTDSSLELSYDESMMYDAASASGSSLLKISSRGGGEGLMLTVSALNDGVASTSAVLKTSSGASSCYVEEEDMEVIDNSDLEVRSTIYTVSDGKALSVNSLEGIDNIEIGLIALPKEETLLRFNINEECALSLYDAETGSYTPIYDGMTYMVIGNVSRRLYLTSACSVKMNEASSIRWNTSGNELIVKSDYADSSTLAVRVYDYAGRCIAAQSADGGEVRLPIDSGVYVLEAENESERICVQVKI